MNIGESIKKYRKIRKMSQQDLSKLSGIPRISISRYENGDRTPNINILNKIATALDTSIESLIYQSNLPEYNTNKFIDYNSEISNYIYPLNISNNSQTFKLKNNPNTKAKNSLVNLLLYATNDSKLVNNLTSEELDTILSKVCDLLEFELYKLSKNTD